MHGNFKQQQIYFVSLITDQHKIRINLEFVEDEINIYLNVDLRSIVNMRCIHAGRDKISLKLVSEEKEKEW